MEIRLLRYFIAVAEELHFTRAALRLSIAQPALSHQIRELERSLGTPLFRRSKRWVRLTEAGTLLLPQARDIVERSEAAARLITRAGKGEVGRLDVGFASSTAGDLLPRAVLAYRARYPDVEVRVRELSTNSQIQGLLSDDLDVGLVHGIDLPAALRAVSLRRGALVVALPAGHHLAQRTRISLADLAHEPFVLGPSQVHHFTDAIIAACAQADFVPRIVQEASDISSRLILVGSGVGITLLPSSSGHLATRTVVYRPLRGHNVDLQLVAAWKPERGSALAKAFLQSLRSVAP